jgi:phage terminase large subunit-like protein
MAGASAFVPELPEGAPEGVYFDGVLAQRPTDFLRLFCVQSKGAYGGLPLVAARWQREDVVWPTFGWRQASGLRLVWFVYVEVPKKNGKSTLVSGVNPYMLIADGENAAECYNAAVDSKQAGMVFEESTRIVKQSPVLDACIRIVPSKKQMHWRHNFSKQEVLSAAVESHEGLNISFANIDEMHVHKTRKLYDTLYYGGESRKQPLFFVITTAGEYDIETIGWLVHDKAVSIIEGRVVDPTMLARVYGIQKGEDPMDPAVWARVNPGWGDIIAPERFGALCRAAHALGGNDWAQFRRYRLNDWSQTEDRWVDYDKWSACAMTFKPADLKGRRCWGGLDLSATDDLTSFTLTFEPSAGSPYFWLLAWHFMPGDKVKALSKKHLVPYHHWIEEGWIEATPGPVVDLDFVRDRIVELCQDYEVDEICFDPHMATRLVRELDEDHGIEMLKHRFGAISINAPMRATERLIIQGRLLHNNNPVMNWEIGNVVTLVDSGGLIKPDKQKGRKKIDGPVAMIMSTGRASWSHGESGPMASEFLTIGGGSG